MFIFKYLKSSGNCNANLRIKHSDKNSSRLASPLNPHMHFARQVAHIDKDNI